VALKMNRERFIALFKELVKRYEIWFDFKECYYN
jgi:hypothetical protein